MPTNNTTFDERMDDLLAAIYLAGTTNGLGREIKDPSEFNHRREAFIKNNPLCGEAKAQLRTLFREMCEEDELLIREKPKDPRLVRRHSGNKYWSVNDGGRIVSYYWKHNLYDKFRSHQDNVFRTEKEAQKHLEYLEAVAMIKADAEWWKPDWSDEGQGRWTGYYIHPNGLGCVETNASQYPCGICFETQKKIEHSQKIHRKEWLIMFGVEELNNKENK